MEAPVRRVRVVCVVRNVVKAQLITTVSNGFTVPPPHPRRLPQLRLHSSNCRGSSPASAAAMPVAAHCPVPRLQVKDARSKIQKLFAKAAQSQSQLISCAARRRRCTAVAAELFSLAARG
eukprot:COSAG04_NODE_1852_length_5394_cov_8.108215_5_plen_120_part_00